MKSITVQVQILENKNMCAIPVPFDPKNEFGQFRAPVKVTLNGYIYRSTIATMGGQAFIPLRKSNREAAGVIGGQNISVKIELDTEKRVVVVPDELKKSLKSIYGAWDKWCDLSYTIQREYAESIQEAKKPETRIRRIDKAIKKITNE